MTNRRAIRATRKRRAGTGAVRQLSSGRWQARYPDADGTLRPAPDTFDTKLDAVAWLDGGVWLEDESPARPDPLFGPYADAWLEQRDLKPRTRDHYRKLLDGWVLPDLAALRLSQITPTRVRGWHAALDSSAPTMRAHAYGLLRTILTTAVEDDLLDTNPCRVRGAGTSRKVHETQVASLAELEAIVAALPSRYRLMALLAAWCAMRFGELAELRRGDVDLDAGVVRVRRAVVRVQGEAIVGSPKSAAGTRTVTIPPHLLPVIAEHLEQHTGAEPGALLFPGTRSGGHMRPSALYRVWYPAREAAGRPDLRFHDLRHTGATLAAATGATLADLMARLGHSTSAAAMRYQHSTADRDRAIAEALSGYATAGVVALESRRRTASGN